MPVRVFLQSFTWGGNPILNVGVPVRGLQSQTITRESGLSISTHLSPLSYRGHKEISCLIPQLPCFFCSETVSQNKSGCLPACLPAFLFSFLPAFLCAFQCFCRASYHINNKWMLCRWNQLIYKFNFSYTYFLLLFFDKCNFTKLKMFWTTSETISIHIIVKNIGLLYIWQRDNIQNM